MFKFLILLIITCSFSACTTNKSNKNEGVSFSSSDKELTNAFNWAKEKALSYVGSNADKSGPWYEAALPGREAFCMRDVSHQCLAAEYLGLHEQNLNMMRLFVQNISENKDWCTYWEINRYNEPAPVDYKNEKEFWYNLPANFDLLQACYELYKISGDDTYIKDSVFLNFYEKTVNEYIESWQLNPEQLATRDRYINAPNPINLKDKFHFARGLPSYIESNSNLRVGSDLIASIYGGLISYAKIAEINGNTDTASYYRERASKYSNLLDTNWWDQDNKNYYSYSTLQNTMEHSEPVTFLLWFNSVKNPERINNVINHLSQKIYNIENSSYLPYLFYKYGRKNEAYSLITYLANPKTKRNEYPEVSFGVIHGIIEGTMGVEVDYASNMVSTMSNLTNNTDWAQVENLEVLSTTLSIKHVGVKETIVSNSGETSVQMKFSFTDTFNKIVINNKKVPVKQNAKNNTIYCVVDSEPYKKLIIKALIDI